MNEFPPPLYPVLDRADIELSVAHPVQLWHHYYAVGYHLHSHTFTEVTVILEGSITHEILDRDGNLRTEQLHAGDVLVVPPGLVHAYRQGYMGQICRRIDICYLTEWFLWDLDLLWDEGLMPLFFASHLFRRSENLRIWQFKLSSEEVAKCKRELIEIEEEYEENDSSLLLVRSTFFKLLVRLARAWRRQTPQSDIHFRPEIWQTIQAVDAIIKEGRTFRVDVFAHGIGMTPKSFARIFQLATGLSPSDYCGRRRTQHAAHLLLESNLSVGEIAAHLGYCDSAHLSRAFLQNEGLSPRAFRNHYRGERSQKTHFQRQGHFSAASDN